MKLSSAPTPREELFALQKKLFLRNQKIIRESITVQEDGFEAYQRNYNRQVARFRRVATLNELEESIQKAHLIYVGDYHTNRHSQRGFLNVLKLQIEKTKDFIIALELLHRKDQPAVDEFLKGKISEEKFLKKIHLQKRWYFDLWENFRPIFEFAKYHRIPIYAVESASENGSLRRRDQACAKTLIALHQAHPHQKIFLLIGDLHLAPAHLPREVQALAKQHRLPLNELTLYQNSEKIYWSLAEQEIEHQTDVVQIDEKSFCLINTPPIVWQQSYIQWLEQEEGEIDYADPKQNFLELTDQIAAILGIKLPSSKEEIEVYTCGDLSFLKHLKTLLKKEQIDRLKKQILLSESYFIPQKRIVYLAHLSLNHAAEEATHFIRYLCAKEEFPRRPADAFYANVLHEALGFFGSKIINAWRTCYHERDFKSLIMHFEKQKESIPAQKRSLIKIGHLFLEYKARERKGSLVSHAEALKLSEDLFFGVTHALGYLLGEMLFHALIEEEISKEEIRELFFDPFKAPGTTPEVYFRLIKRYKTLLPKSVKKRFNRPFTQK